MKLPGKQPITGSYKPQATQKAKGGESVAAFQNRTAKMGKAKRALAALKFAASNPIKSAKHVFDRGVESVKPNKNKSFSITNPYAQKLGPASEHSAFSELQMSWSKVTPETTQGPLLAEQLPDVPSGNPKPKNDTTHPQVDRSQYQPFKVNHTGAPPIEDSSKEPLRLKLDHPAQLLHLPKDQPVKVMLTEKCIAVIKSSFKNNLAIPDNVTIVILPKNSDVTFPITFGKISNCEEFYCGSIPSNSTLNLPSSIKKVAVGNVAGSISIPPKSKCKIIQFDKLSSTGKITAPPKTRIQKSRQKPNASEPFKGKMGIKPTPTQFRTDDATADRTEQDKIDQYGTRPNTDDPDPDDDNIQY